MSGNTFRKKQSPKPAPRSSSGSRTGDTQIPIEFNVSKDSYLLAFGIFLLILSVSLARSDV